MHIERLHSIDRETLVGSYLARNRPVVIRLRDRRWLSAWASAALAARYGQTKIQAEERRHFYVEPRRIPTRSLGSLLARIAQNERRARWTVETVPELRAALLADPAPYEPLFPEGTSGRRTTLWISPCETSSLHHDGDYDNFNLQIEGKKVFRLVPPSQRALLYCYGSAESPIDPFAPDRARFPRFDDADVFDAELAPGDMLVIPKYWWHCVETIEPSVNLATFFRWPGAPSPWSVLAGAPIVPRALTAVSAAMKKRDLIGLANVGRRAWWTAYQAVVPRIEPQARGARPGVSRSAG